MRSPMKIGDSVQIKIETVAFGGEGIGRVESRVVFVPFAVGGDAVEVEIRDVKKRFARGMIKKLLVASPKRTEPPCSYFHRCGGCQYQHIQYSHQLEIKQRQVVDSFERIGKIPSPPVREIIPSSGIFNYRGKAEYHVAWKQGKHPAIGFMDITGGTVMEIERCEIVDESINRDFGRFRESLARKEFDCEGDRRIFWSTGSDDGGDETTGVSWEFDTTRRVVKDTFFFVPFGGFFQANNFLVDTLVDEIVARSIEGPSDVLVDCYCGSGLFSLFLSPHFRRVRGIEVDGQAVQCARFNFQMNGIANAEVLEGRVEDVLNRRCIGDEPIDLILLDPPRTGCREETLDRIVRIKPDRILYVSCNPATQARDIRYLVGGGYVLSELQPIDMFPQTKHIEVIALLNWLP